VEVHGEVVEIESPGWIPVRMNGKTSFFVDPEVAEAPALDVVEIQGIPGGP
jgi:hypothetical protein